MLLRSNKNHDPHLVSSINIYIYIYWIPSEGRDFDYCAVIRITGSVYTKFIQRGGPLHQKLGEILACHWSDFKNSGLLLAETAEISKIKKNQAPNLTTVQ